MFAIVGLSLIAVLSGTQLTYLYDRDSPLLVRLCAGACAGYALLGTVGLVAASSLGFEPRTILLTAAVVASPLLILLRAQFREQALANVCEAGRGLRQAIAAPVLSIVSYIAYSGTVALLLLVVFDRAVF